LPSSVAGLSSAACGRGAWSSRFALTLGPRFGPCSHVRAVIGSLHVPGRCGVVDTFSS
jgi:hypothetical protein